MIDVSSTNNAVNDVKNKGLEKIENIIVIGNKKQDAKKEIDKVVDKRLEEIDQNLYLSDEEKTKAKDSIIEKANEAKKAIDVSDTNAKVDELKDKYQNELESIIYDGAKEKAAAIAELTDKANKLLKDLENAKTQEELDKLIKEAIEVIKGINLYAYQKVKPNTKQLPNTGYTNNYYLLPGYLIIALAYILIKKNQEDN